MRPSQIEAWALKVIEQVEARQPTEDSRVELKAQWPDVSTTEKARNVARQIGGHANAARGEPILWLIGVDQLGAVVNGVDFNELSVWFGKVKTEFDGLAPSLTDLNVPHNGLTVAALLFQTERPPFVVRNPVDGLPKCGPVSLEVPWREGTSTRSASREELLRLLIPVQKLPELEVLRAYLGVTTNEIPPSPPRGFIWSFRVEYYGVPSAGSQTVIPSHKCRFDISFDAEPFPNYSNEYVHFGLNVPAETSLIQANDDQVVLNGAGRFAMEMTRHTEVIDMRGWDKANVRAVVTLCPVNAERPVVREIHLRPAPQVVTAFKVAYWTLDSVS
jgi:hypothetical protein